MGHPPGMGHIPGGVGHPAGMEHPPGMTAAWRSHAGLVAALPAVGNRSPLSHLPVHSAQVPGVTQSSNPKGTV